MALSVIIPTYNEMGLGLLEQTLFNLKDLQRVEVILSDGGSSDGTCELGKEMGASIVSSSQSSRAQRLNDGAHSAKGELLLFHHPRSVIDVAAVSYLIENNRDLKWGGFTHVFDDSHPILDFTSWYSNHLRARRGIVYLDHCLFLQRQLFEKIGDLPSVEIFEDTILSRKLLKVAGMPTILPFLSTTSAVRFRRNGIFKQAFFNQWLKIQFLLGFSDKKMNQQYEKRTKLNTDHEKS